MFRKYSYNKIKIIIVCIIFIICIIYSFVNIIYYDSKIFVESIMNEFNNNYITKEKINKKLVYDSLNKIISYDDINYSVIESIPVIKKEQAIKKEYNPKVYIYNSHQTESYSMPFVSDYSVTPTVLLASYILKDFLNDYKIDSYVETRSVKEYLNKHKLSYYYCYDATRYFMDDIRKKYNFEYYIDIHRDSVAKSKVTLKSNNKNYAKILFVVALKHKNSSKNLAFAQKLSKSLNNKINNLSRGIYKRDEVRFNQDISNSAILLELGSDKNTLLEINNTLEVFASVLNEEINGK